jgi:hypothetical protein
MAVETRTIVPMPPIPCITSFNTDRPTAHRAHVNPGTRPPSPAHVLLSPCCFLRSLPARLSGGANRCLLGVLLGLCFDPAVLAASSIARVWNEQALQAIRRDTPHPPAQARNLFSLSVCMYDAWAAYDPLATGYVYRGKHAATDVAKARHEAISFAAYRMLKERHVYSRTASATLAADDHLFANLGYDPNHVSRDTSSPAGVGNAVYDTVSAWFINDGARQTHGTPYPLAIPPIAYPDHPVSEGGYVYANDPLPASVEGIVVNDINRWQRLQIVNAIDQNGFPQGPIQTYLGAHWLGVRPVALARSAAAQPWIDLGPPPYFDSPTHALFVSNCVEVIRYGSELTPDDGVTLDISPGAIGNNNLGANDGHGHSLNPFTGQPYSSQIVKRGDFTRALSEYWADGPNSETPPGHWNLIANHVSDAPSVVKKIAGQDPRVDDLEWDVKLYFALNAALHDAACAAWGAKRLYDGWRPICAIRFLGQLGQSSDPAAASYHPNGLPLIPNLIELVTPLTAAPGNRHENLAPGKIAIRGWPGQPSNPATTYQGVIWLHADRWIPYQARSFVTPAFPGYPSGHSTFSRSAAEVLTAFTGSPYFPGGLASYTITNLLYELGPTQPLTLQWATYYDAADQVGLSRIWGGIHPPADDFAGRKMGAECGQAVWALARQFFDGSIRHAPVTLTIRPINAAEHELRYNTIRGLYYKLQSTAQLDQPFLDESADAIRALESSVAHTNFANTRTRLYRAVSSLTP